MRKRKWFLGKLVSSILLFAVLLSSPSTAIGQDAKAGLKMGAEAGFNGLFKYGEWLPVWVKVENGGADIEAEIQVRVVDGGRASTFSAPVSLPTNSRKRVPLYVLPNNFSRELTVQLVADGKELLTATVKVNPQINQNYLVGIISPEQGPLGLISSIELAKANRQIELVHFPLAELPERSEGLASLDTLILNNVDTSDLTPQQSLALETWVGSGGRLVVGGGAGAAQTTAGLSDSLFPFTLGDLLEVDELPGLVEYVEGGAVRVPGPFVAAAGEAAGGRELAGQEDLVLIQEWGVGAGAVDFVALDLTGSPFDAWSGTPAFWEMLLSPGSRYPDWLPVDMSTRQMGSDSMIYALSNLGNLDLPSVRGLGIMLIVYVILVGPVNYFTLRYRKQLHFAWITIPLITALFSVGTFGLAYALRGNDLIVNKIAVIELQLNSTAKVNSYLGLFSPAQQSYQIEVSGGGLLSPLRMSYYDPWMSGNTSVGEASFLQGEPGKVRGLAVNQWSMQTLMAEGILVDLGVISADLKLEAQTLSGTVRNQTTLTLTDTVLIFGNQIIRMGDLAPGEEKTIGAKMADTPKELFGPSLSYRLFAEDFERSSPTGPPRDVMLKQAVVESVFQNSWGGGGGGGGGGGIFPGVGISSGGGREDRSMLSSILFLGWADEAPPDVRVAGRDALQQTTAMVMAPLSFHFAEGKISLPPGYIPGYIVEMPVRGGYCGPSEMSVFLEAGEAVFEFQLPEGIQGAQIDTWLFDLQSDFSRTQVPEIAFYDWAAGEWDTLSKLEFGRNEIEDTGKFVSADGLVRIQLSKQGGGDVGCFYLALGLEGRR